MLFQLEDYTVTDKHIKEYPVNVQLLSNGDEPPILDFICFICKERMRYYSYFGMKNSKPEEAIPVKHFLRLRCVNEHTTDVQLVTFGYHPYTALAK